jgi:hypothetical protein
MGKGISRRSFLTKSAIALGTVATADAVFDFKSIGGAAQAGGSKTLSAKALKEREMPHVIVRLWPGRSEQEKIRLAEP